MAGDAHELLGTLVLNLIMRTAAIRHDRAVRGVDGADPKTLTRFINVVDEVQNFLCPEMTKVLTEGRAMRCSLWAAHQYMHQIKEKDKSMAEAFANAGTSVLFGTTIDDAKNVAEFIDDPRFTATVVSNMPKYHFVLQRKDGEPVTGQTIPMAGKDQKRVHKVRRYSAAQVAGGVHRAAVVQRSGSSVSVPGTSQEHAADQSTHATANQAVQGSQNGYADTGAAAGAAEDVQRANERLQTADPSQSSSHNDGGVSGRSAEDQRRRSASRYGDRESQRNEREKVSARIRGRTATSEQDGSSAQIDQQQTSDNSETEAASRQQENAEADGAGSTDYEELPE